MQIPPPPAHSRYGKSTDIKLEFNLVQEVQKNFVFLQGTTEQTCCLFWEDKLGTEKKFPKKVKSSFLEKVTDLGLPDSLFP